MFDTYLFAIHILLAVMIYLQILASRDTIFRFYVLVLDSERFRCNCLTDFWSIGCNFYLVFVGSFMPVASSFAAIVSSYIIPSNFSSWASRSVQ